MDEGQRIKVIENEGAKHVIAFYYCGGWGYNWATNEAIKHIELRFGKIFNYLRVHDKGITGRLEAHLYANTLEPTGNGYTVIHSKNASGTFIASD